MRTIGTLGALIIFYFLYGFYISQYDLAIVSVQLKNENPAGFYDYRGAINIHSNRSIGSAPLSFIAASARNAGLDYIVMTDLNQFEDTDIRENYQGRLLILNGAKYSYLDSRLIYYSPAGSIVGANLGEVQVRFADLLSQKPGSNKNSLLYLAHPYNLGFSWSGDIPDGLDGIEILNLKSLSVQAWKENKLSTIWSLFIYPFNSRLALTRLFSEPSEELALFDKMSQKRDFVGFAGTEASARALPFSDYLIKFPSYKRVFEIMSNHVLLRSELTGNFTTDRQKIFQALKSGQFYAALDILGDPKGFFAAIEDRNKTYLFGSHVKLSKSLTMKVLLPNVPKEFFEIVIYRNGERYKTFNASDISFPVEQPGTYRVQVRVSPLWPLPDARKWISWIYTNPFYVEP